MTRTHAEPPRSRGHNGQTEAAPVTRVAVTPAPDRELRGSAAAEGPADVTLADVIEDLAEEYPDVRSAEVPGGMDYLVGDRAFVRLAGIAAHFRLRVEIVAAAVRTPAASSSTLGPDWVLFRPMALDQYGLDRAQAWWELGHRLALEARPKGPGRH